MPISGEARRSGGIDACGFASAAGGEADACEPAGGVDTSSGEAACSGLAIAAEAAPWDAGCGEAGASLGARGASDWLQEAAAKPSAAQISGRKILIMDAL